ncbi:MAG: response regulator [Betaproteobacteria bacterium]|nr:response regulator [Betaproteobacteria bacterium]MDE2359033.1 response regulator [Betaproteobacteria bacterium]
MAERPDSEHEQALLRIAIVGMFLAYMAGAHGWPGNWSAHDARVVAILAAFLAAATAIFVAICIRPAANVPRRLFGMLADTVGCTWYMWVTGDYGFFVIGVYLFITFGNGFRYGRKYLFGCQALCLTGLIAVLAFSPYWQNHRIAGLGLLTALVVLPLYVSTLLNRIQEALAHAEEANLAKTSFLANMSHEMRTPLNGIVGLVDLLKVTPLTTQQGELVSLLRHSISVLRSLVDDVLDISKIEAGRLTLEVAPFDLHASINGLVQLLRPHAGSKGIALHAVVDPALEFRLKGDSHHLRQVLLNLLGNAIKFTERGEVSLIVSQKLETPEAVTARFEVKDTGIGIAPEAISKIFERFVQADQSTTRKYGGTGLGTTIAKQLVELMGGTIGVESTLGQGSTFWLELPFLKDAGHQEASPSTATVPDEDIGPAAGDEITLVMASGALAQITSTLRAIGERYEIVTPMTPLGARVDALVNSGIKIRAIVAACDVDQACSAFAVAAQRLHDRNVAFVYIANGELSVVDRARVNSITGAFAFEYPSARLLANAIHSVTVGDEQATAGAGDLSFVLKRQRLALKVLVAEDNPTNQKIICQLLESAGHHVILASDGEEALDLYELEQPDLAILDFNMPERSGVEVIQAIRTMEPANARMPALILSASVTTEARDRAKRAGADEFMGKPFDAATLVAEIDRLGKRSERAKKGATAHPPVPLREGPRPSKPQNSGVSSRPDLPSKASKRSRGTIAESDAALVDPARIAQLEDIGRDPSFLIELIRGFAGDVDGIIAKTRQAIATATIGDIPDLMHTLKGAAVGVGARKLATLAVDLETAPESRSSEELANKLEAISACFASTSACLNNYIQAGHPASL